MCGTDVEFFTGEMAYLHGARALPDAARPRVVRCGRRRRRRRRPGLARPTRHRRHHARVRALPPMPGGRQHVCADRYEIGIRGGWPGALAEQLPVPANALHALPDTVDATAGALVEPGGNALRAVRGAALARASGCWSRARAPSACSPRMIAAAAGRRGAPDRPDRAPRSTSRATLGFARRLDRSRLPDLPWDAVIDASNAAACRRWPLDLVEPAGGSSTSGSPARPA